MVWCLRLKSQDGAVVDGTIVVFYGTRDRLAIQPSEHVPAKLDLLESGDLTGNSQNSSAAPSISACSSKPKPCHPVEPVSMIQPILRRFVVSVSSKCTF